MQIVTKLCTIQQFDPILLTCSHIMSEILLKQPIHPLGLAIHLRVICCGEL
ncbi:hypothetical protein LOK49_LG04G02867 [Camellia lanceoleosa]|uniref:Uncharacterized protein n=1 Tax=Camellia lanceoleosa TaxID=1840588 RepID=A0ACC0I3K2_9ERIC|nr:hypothetical protein LOK49_LG04G02867 [Camellia lanceoleosa]